MTLHFEGKIFFLNKKTVQQTVEKVFIKKALSEVNIQAWLHCMMHICDFILSIRAVRQ